MDVDLESLVHLEQSFYDEGYNDGFAHGQMHGLIEGRALGREKGYEMFEELGFYEGFAQTWKQIHEKSGKSENRSMYHIRHLLELISQFPRKNPSTVASTDGSEELDIQKLFRQIRSRYKALCATLGVRPNLRATEPGEEDALSEIMQVDGSVADNKKLKVWSVDAIGKRSTGEQLSF